MYKHTLIVSLLLCFSALVDAQIPALFLEELSYRSVGPTRGGRVTAIAGIPSQPYTFWMGATGGGVWKTNDAGQHWVPMADGKIKAGSIGAIAVAPSNTNVVYVGTGSAAPRGNVSAGIGLYKSENGGGSWTYIGLPEAGQIGDIIVHPDNPQHLYVAALGHIFGKNEERGIYESTDGGASWDAIFQLNDSTGAIDLAMNPHNPLEMYGAFWRCERKPWTLIDGSADGGIYKTLDGGKNWTKLKVGLPTGLIGRIGIDVSPANPQTVYAIIQAKKEEEGGVYRSSDGGESWQRTSRDHNLRQRGWYYSNITAHPTNEHEVYVSNVGFFKSIDGGKSFDRMRTPHSDNHGVWINPLHPSIMINCNDGGANITLNGGSTWSAQLNQPTSEFYRVTVDDQFPYRLYAGQQDNTTISVPSRTPRSVTPYQHWMAVGGGESADVAIDPNNPNRIWAGTYSGEITILDRQTGHIRQVTAYPHYTEGTEMRNLKYRWQWNFPIVASQHEENVVYHTSNYVHRTRNDGQTWERISPDLTRNIDAYMGIPGGPIQHDATGVEVYATIFAFEESPHTAGVFWAGSDDGLLHISRDNGNRWENITPDGLPREATINKIELSMHKPGKAFVVAYNYRYDDFTPYVFVTHNYGKSWKNIGIGIPDHAFVRSIAEDPNREGLLFAGTEYGVFLSVDEGTSWQALQQNLPVTPITDMEIHQGDLVLSTQGRAFWILDDLSVLHQLTDDIIKSDRYVFEPRPAVRTNIYGFNAEIPIFLKDGPGPDPVRIEIVDANGNVVRKLSTDAEDNQHKIRLKRGMNTVNWNLRHTGPEVVDNLVTMVIGNPPAGPLATPGEYQVKVTHGDWMSDVPLTIKPDPRWQHVSQADYQAQLEVAQVIGDMLTESHKRIMNIRSLSAQIKTTANLAQKAGYGPELGELANEIVEKLSAVENLIIQNKAEASQDNINFPRVFSNHIGRLYSVVANGHHRPTDGAMERLEDLKKEYAGIVEAYSKVMNQEIPAFNAMLAEKQVSRLIIPEKVK